MRVNIFCKNVRNTAAVFESRVGIRIHNMFYTLYNHYSLHFVSLQSLKWESPVKYMCKSINNFEKDLNIFLFRLFRLMTVPCYGALETICAITITVLLCGYILNHF